MCNGSFTPVPTPELAAEVVKMLKDQGIEANTVLYEPLAPPPPDAISEDQHEANFEEALAEGRAAMENPEEEHEVVHSSSGVWNDDVGAICAKCVVCDKIVAWRGNRTWEHVDVPEPTSHLDSLREAAQGPGTKKDVNDQMNDAILGAAQESFLPSNSAEWRELMFRPGMSSAMMFVLYEVVHRAVEGEYESQDSLISDLAAWKQLTMPQREALVGLFAWIETEVVSPSSVIPEALRSNLRLAYASYEDSAYPES